MNNLKITLPLDDVQFSYNNNKGEIFSNTNSALTQMIQNQILEYETDEDSDVYKINQLGRCPFLKKISGNFNSIPSSAFYSNSNLQLINLPSCTSIGSSAFYNCTNLSSVNLPSCTSIGPFAFQGCSNLSSINLPNCSAIMFYTFKDCVNLSSIDLPNCSYISTSAFYNCTNLSSINLPSCTTIGSSAFYNCTNLSSINLPNCTYINSHAFSNCNNLSSIDLPNCRTIGSYAFGQCLNLSSIDLPNCTTIYSNAFYGCINLSFAYFGASAITMNDNPFYYANPNMTVVFSNISQLTSTSNYYIANNLIFPNCKTVQSSAYYNKTGLNFIDLPSCTTVGPYAFYGCSNLSSINLSNCIYINSYAFYGCSNLSAISLPNCSYIYSYAFAYCSNLSSITFSKSITISSYALSGVKILSMLEIPGGSFYDYAFYNASISHLKIATLPTISTSAFVGATINTLTFPGENYWYSSTYGGYSGRLSNIRNLVLTNTQDIYSSGFYGYLALRTVKTFNLKNIYSNAFNQCSNLKSLYLLYNGVCTLSTSYTFQNTNRDFTIYVPESLVDTYKSRTNWTYFKNKIVAYTE